jgi:zinc finger protein
MLKCNDWRTDVFPFGLQSETCGLEIPEIDLILQPGTLGGRFTTMEGLLQQVYDELSTKVFHTGSGSGDSAPREGENSGTTFHKFLGDLKKVMEASMPFTLILDDPVANSYLQNIYAPDEDPNMTIESYTRSFEQDEELGINDMVLSGYENEHPEVEGEKKEGEEEVKA